MATETKRKIVKGIEHGLGGYTNYRCRCDICTQANRDHSREYRQRRFAGDPLCVIPRCSSPQSHSYGNGLCYNHARAVLDFRDALDRMNRLELKRLIKNNNLKIEVRRSHTDDDLRTFIAGKMKLAEQVQLGVAA